MKFDNPQAKGEFLDPLQNRAAHLIGEDASGEEKRTPQEAKLQWIGATQRTIEDAQVRVKHGSETLYFRNYKEGTHMVVTEDGAVTDPLEGARRFIGHHGSAPPFGREPRRAVVFALSSAPESFRLRHEPPHVDEVKAAQAANARFAEASKAVAAVEKQARNQAREEAADWRAEQDAMQAKDWSFRAALVRDLRALDAILSVLPPELRGKVGGFTKLATLGSDQARLKELGRRIDRDSRGCRIFGAGARPADESGGMRGGARHVSLFHRRGFGDDACGQ